MISPTLFALHSWHPMKLLRVQRRSRQESRPAKHRLHLASSAVALGWPRRKDRDTGILKAVFFCELQEETRDQGAQRKCYKDQLQRQLVQAIINHQLWQQETSDSDSCRSSARKNKQTKKRS